MSTRHSSPKRPVIATQMGTLTLDTVTVRGYELNNELIGYIDAGALLFLEVQGRLPDEREARMLNALIVSIAEHGMMPSVIAARLTIMGAPESFQGAVASGLLGAGDVFVGPTSNVARLLQVEMADLPGDDDSRARQIVEIYAKAKKRIAGFGHPHHEIDPRSVRLLALQKELGLPSRDTELMLAVHRAACERAGRHLTFNAVAAVGAIASDLGFDWRVVRGIGLVARTIGLIGHVFEELKNPVANTIWDLVHEHTEYTDPAGRSSGDGR